MQTRAAESHHRTLYHLLLWTTRSEKMLDKERMEDLIKHSDMDWTLVRPSFLTNGPPTRQYQRRSDLRMQITSHISRADVAAFMLHHIPDTSSLYNALALTA